MAYIFPFTTTGEMNLDWLLNQMKALGEDYTDFTSKVKNVLAGYSVGIEEFMSWFPEGTFTVTKNTDGIITAVTMAEGALSFEELLAGHLQSYVDAAYAQAERAKGFADQAQATVGGAFVSYGVAQSLSNAQKETARYNIGITNDLFQSKNMFVISGTMRIARIQNYAVVVQPNDYVGYNEEYQSIWYASGSQESGSVAGRRMICASNTVSQNIKIPRGTYTVSLRVHRKNSDVVWPSNFYLGVGLAPTGNSANGSKTTSKTVHLTATRGEESGSENVFGDAENSFGWLKATIKIDFDDAYFGLIIQNNAAQGNMRLDGLVFDTIQIEAGSEVTEYVAYGSEMTAVDKTAREIATQALEAVDQDISFVPENLPEAVSTFILDGGTSENAFCWFSDQHPNPGANFDNYVRDDITKMAAHYKSFPSQMLVDGGDWITSALTMAASFESMRKIMGISKDIIQPYEQFVHLPGNHDNNSVYPTDRAIPRGAMSVLYGNGSTYGVIETRDTAFLCIDSGSPAISTNTEWAGNEVIWFLEYLANCTKPFVIAMSHQCIKDNLGWNYLNPPDPRIQIKTNQENQALNEIAHYLMAALDGMNTNGSYRYPKNGVLYNFNAGTKCIFWISGHSHKQIVGQYGSRLPFICVPNWGLNAASASNPKNTEAWTYVISKVDAENVTTLFWQTGAVTGLEVHDGDHTGDNKVTINEGSWYLNWDRSFTSFAWDPYVEE